MLFSKSWLLILMSVRWLSYQQFLDIAVYLPPYKLREEGSLPRLQAEFVHEQFWITLEIFSVIQAKKVMSIACSCLICRVTHCEEMSSIQNTFTLSESNHPLNAFGIKFHPPEINLWETSTNVSSAFLRAISRDNYRTLFFLVQCCT